MSSLLAAINTPCERHSAHTCQLQCALIPPTGGGHPNIVNFFEVAPRIPH